VEPLAVEQSCWLRVNLVAALARLAEAGEPLPGPGQQRRRVRARTESGDQEKDFVWFALDDGRPLFTFAGIWMEFKGDRGTTSKPIPGPNLVYRFLRSRRTRNDSAIEIRRSRPGFAVLF
jgi:hypothetical protein